VHAKTMPSLETISRPQLLGVSTPLPTIALAPIFRLQPVPRPMPTLAKQCDHFICVTCGTQFRETAGPPKNCPICLDERQYVGPDGQAWTTLRAMQCQGFKNVFREMEPGVASITIEPKFAIGQRAFLIQTPAGNILWDCVSLIDDATIAAVMKCGPLAAIAISHPHYYTSMVEWSAALGNVPIHLHAADRQWVQRPDPRIHFWEGDAKPLSGDLRLIHTPGHFAGFQVLHWPGGADGRGALFSGDQPQVCADPNWVSFMWSYPNYIPLGANDVRKIAQTLEPLPFDRIYGAFPPGVVKTNAKDVMARSVKRYLARVGT
jgi:hypothetical protein